MKRRRLAAIAGLTLPLVAATGSAAAIRAQAPPPVTVRQTHIGEMGRPPPGPPTAVPTLAGETPEQYRQRLLREGGGKVYDIREETRGKPVTLGGKTVQLPPDAYVDGMVTHVLCGGSPEACETPFYNIRRGRSLINVTVRTGRILSEHIAPGEEGAFDFLKEALR